MVFLSGIAINVSPVSPLLSVSLALTSVWKGAVTGLLGNFNDDITDEFITPDGTNLGDSTTFTEEQIFNSYGNLWRVSESESLITYTGGDSYQSVNDDAFTPIFFDANLTVMFPNATRRAQAISICLPGQTEDPNPAERSQCYFDFAVLNSETLAQSTVDNLQKVDESKAALSNFAPVISNSNTTLELIGGSSYSSLYTLEASDPNGNSITFATVTGTPSGVTVQPNGDVSFIAVPTTTPFTIQIAVSDGSIATIWEPHIKYCFCQNSGVCNFGTDPVVEQFTVVPCQCPAGWEGTSCDTDIDGCADSPCFPGVICSDVPAAQITTFPAGFKCDVCPIGLQGDGQSCNDIDECTSSPCSQICTNEVGGFTCSCNSGYLLAKDLTSCTDIDECTVGTDDCDTVATCNNTVGGFTCSCMSGYTDTGSGKDGQCQDINECTELTEPCPSNSTCQNTAGSFTCTCDAGYQLDPSSNTCNDIDDCALQDSCEQLCVDGVNTFTCACETGFIVDSSDNTQCVANVDCNSTQRADCSAGNTTTSTCALDSRGNVICLCKSGYGKGGSDICVDINECQTGVDACEEATCTNTDGGYTCTCNQGYTFKSGSQLICEDIDECLSSHQCVSPATCVNSPGSYVCSCPTGYTRSNDGLQCNNTDECADSATNPCDTQDATCTDNVGSFTCACNSGFAGDGFLCSDLNECTLADRGGCAQGCQNSIGGFQCFCGEGFTLNADNRTCDDVNECTSSTTNLCFNNTFCTNTVGGFTCSCPSGFVLKADGYTCQSTSVCADNHGCEFTCDVIDGQDTCTCERGYELNSDGLTCSDINECTTDGATLCLSSNNVICNNLPGSYSCVCTNTSLYTQVEEDRCIDIDECLNNPCQANAQCQNTVPGFTCTCLSGFTDLDGVCTDINECGSGAHNCHATLATCTNTDGAYTCACNVGYSGNGIQCEDIDECIQGTSGCDAIGSCVNSEGSFTCTCPSGYNLAANGKNCNDIDECALNATLCSDICTNTDGGFECSCQSGTSLGADQRTCTVNSECETSYQNQCDQTCAKTNGTDTCLCSEGFELASNGFNCDDINECSTSPPCDSTRGICSNTVGGFTCACSDGYILGENNACTDRDGGYTAWSAWSTCSATCGVGITTRTRTCTNPTVQGNGAPCSGPDTDTETQSCTQDPCPITTEEVDNGINMTLSGLTISQFESIVSQFKSSVASSINGYCSLNQANARACCNNQLNYSPTSSLTFTSADNVLISSGYPTLNADDTLQVLFVVKYDPTNSLCTSGTARRRKKRSLLTGNEAFITQDTLLLIIQTQQNSLVTTIVNQGEVVLGITLPLTIETLSRTSNTGSTNSNVEDDDDTPGWVIAVAVIGSVVAVVIIVLIIYVLVKLKSNKVEAFRESQEDVGQGGSQGHRQVGQSRGQSQRHQQSRGIEPNLQQQKHAQGQTHQISVVPVEEVEI